MLVVSRRPARGPPLPLVRVHERGGRAIRPPAAALSLSCGGAGSRPSVQLRPAVWPAQAPAPRMAATARTFNLFPLAAMSPPSPLFG